VVVFLEREGCLVRDDDNDSFALDGLEDNLMLLIQGNSITYRIAKGKARTKGLYLANHCTYCRTRTIINKTPMIASNPKK
jgi:hypothetical protein